MLSKRDQKMKRYSKDFRQADIERIRNGEPQSVVAKDLGIGSKTLNSWWCSTKDDLSPKELSDAKEIIPLRRLLREKEAEINFLKKSERVLRQTFLMKYAYLDQCIKCLEIGQRSFLPIPKACRLLKVSVSGFYSWKKVDHEHRHGFVRTDNFIITLTKAFIKEQGRDFATGL